jgi:tRNA A-37 threonylcarbamoyl transferase component Bud32
MNTSSILEGCPTIEDIKDFLEKRSANPKNPEFKLLGRGSYGEVFRYKDFVIKILDLKDSFTRQTFEREREALDKLTDIKELEGYITPFCWSAENTQQMGFIVQKYIQSITLEDFLKQTIVIPYSFGFKLLQHLMEGLFRLHKAGYIHRDLKPANILIRAGRAHPEELKTVPILIDFGFACALPCLERQRLGTPNYFPENWSSATNLLRMVGPNGERYTYRNKAYIRKRERTLKNVVKGHLPAPLKWTNEIQFSRKVGGPGPNWKLLKTQPYALTPIHSERTDSYAIYRVFKQIFDRIDWDGHEKDEEATFEYMERLRGHKLAALAAQYAREEPEFVKARRMEALKRLNSRREARMENRAREDANAELLASFAEAPLRNNTRKRGRGPNANRPAPQSRPRQSDAPHA